LSICVVEVIAYTCFTRLLYLTRFVSLKIDIGLKHGISVMSPMLNDFKHLDCFNETAKISLKKVYYIYYTYFD